MSRERLYCVGAEKCPPKMLTLIRHGLLSNWSKASTIYLLYTVKGKERTIRYLERGSMVFLDVRSEP